MSARYELVRLSDGVRLAVGTTVHGLKKLARGVGWGEDYVIIRRRE